MWWGAATKSPASVWALCASCMVHSAGMTSCKVVRITYTLRLTHSLLSVSCKNVRAQHVDLRISCLHYSFTHLLCGSGFSYNTLRISCALLFYLWIVLFCRALFAVLLLEMYMRLFLRWWKLQRRGHHCPGWLSTCVSLGGLTMKAPVVAEALKAKKELRKVKAPDVKGESERV